MKQSMQCLHGIVGAVAVSGSLCSMLTCVYAFECKAGALPSAVLRSCVKQDCSNVQNVRPDKLFSKERAVKQLLEIIDECAMSSNGKFYAWDKQEIVW